jgi:hypothetical protein
MTRRELVARMGEDELREWLAFDQLHPLPDAHWDAALIASTTARAMGAKGVKLEHMLPVKETAKGSGPIVGAGVLAVIRRAKARAKHGANQEH